MATKKIPSFAGTKWSNNEEKELLCEIQKGDDINQIAIIHKRTVGAIKSRLSHIAVRMINDGKSYEEVSEILKLPIESIQFIIEKNKNSNNTENNDLLNLLKDIKDILLRIETKLEK